MGEDARERDLRFVMDRRRFLALTGGGAMAALLAACGLSSDNGSSPSVAASGSASPLPPVGGPLNLYTWEGYDTAGGLTKWMKAQGMTANI